MADDRPRIEMSTLADLRNWLAQHHEQRESVWLVRYKAASGRPVVPYADIVDELLCVGWIDSVPRKLDDERFMTLISPRSPSSNWSGVNKRKVERLEREGRLQPAGRAMVDLARRNGNWTFLDDVDRLELPDDLVAALATVPDAQRLFDRFPDSAKRGILEWIKTAKTEGTRAKRIALTASRAAQNRKANFPAGRDHGPPDIQ